MTIKLIKQYNCKCEYTAPYICSYCINKSKAPKWVSIVWKGKMCEINAKGEIRVEKRKKT